MDNGKSNNSGSVDPRGFNLVSLYLGRVTERPLDANGNLMHVKPIISSNVVALTDDVLIDNALVRSVDRNKYSVMYCLTDYATEWLKAPFLVVYYEPERLNEPLRKWFDTQQEADAFNTELLSRHNN